MTIEFNEEYAKVMFPWLERSVAEEWELIKAKKSELSRMKRDKIQALCEELEAQDKKGV